MTEGERLAGVGTPPSDAEHVDELVASAEPLSPEVEQFAHFLIGALPPEEMQQVADRLATDTEFAAWAAPLLAMARHRPRAVTEVAERDVDALASRVQSSLAGLAIATTPKERLGPLPLPYRNSPLLPCAPEEQIGGVRPGHPATAPRPERRHPDGRANRDAPTRECSRGR